MPSIKEYLAEPELPPNKTYTSINNYLIGSAQADIKYYTIVSWIGVLGIVISVCLSVFLAMNGGNPIVISNKEYPAFLGSLITTAFGQIELQQKKKELYNKLKEMSESDSTNADRNDITDKYKSFSWQEFTNRFNPQA